MSLGPSRADRGRGSLAIEAEHVCAIGVGEVLTGISSHYAITQEVVLRRVRAGG